MHKIGGIDIWRGVNNGFVDLKFRDIWIKACWDMRIDDDNFPYLELGIEIIGYWDWNKKQKIWIWDNLYEHGIIDNPAEKKY